MKKGISISLFGRFLAAAVLFFTYSANAQNITYHVDRVFGGGYENNYGHIVGTIETDGTLGPLSPGKIKSWSFEIFDGTDVVSISSATGFLQGTAWGYLTATDTALSFDFEGASADPDPSVELIAFVGGNSQVPETASYNLLGNFVGQVEQLIHQFGEPPFNGEHRVDSLRRTVEVIARVDKPSMDCSAPSVSLGEVMAGLQSGFTAGSHTDFGPAGSYMLGLFGEDQRGFVIPGSIDVSQQCENDFILISRWFGARISTSTGETVRTPKEAIDLVNGLLVGQRFEVDGVLIEPISTPAKIGALPSGLTLAAFSSGIIIEPNSLDQGLHIADVVYEFDTNGDGIADFERHWTAAFKINSAE